MHTLMSQSSPSVYCSMWRALRHKSLENFLWILKWADFQCTSLLDNSRLRGLHLDWHGAMLARIVSRICWLWFVLFSAFICGSESVSAQSCHEVKTAFQLRQVGPLKWVPETAATGSFIASKITYNAVKKYVHFAQRTFF